MGRTWPMRRRRRSAICSGVDRRAPAAHGGPRMKRRERVLALIVSASFVSAVTIVSEVAHAGPASYLFCTAISSQQGTAGGSVKRGVTYFSATFVTDDPNLRPVSDAFLKYLETKYGFK